jgi:putative PIN family toxin of toxin-antitoxin system
VSTRLVVLDTNVLVSALLTDGACREIVRLWIDESTFEVATCPQLFGELSRVLQRPKIRRYATSSAADALLGLVAVAAEWWPDPVRSVRRTRDVMDDHVVQFALDVGADLLVSGDSDMQVNEVARVARVEPPTRALRTMQHWHS